MHIPKQLIPKKTTFHGLLGPSSKYTCLILWTLNQNSGTYHDHLTTPAWRTARGEYIPVPQLTTKHINNIIKCWEGQGNTNIPKNYHGGKAYWMEILKAELSRRN